MGDVEQEWRVVAVRDVGFFDSEFCWCDFVPHLDDDRDWFPPRSASKAAQRLLQTSITSLVLSWSQLLFSPSYNLHSDGKPLHSLGSSTVAGSYAGRVLRMWVYTQPGYVVSSKGRSMCFNHQGYRSWCKMK